MALKAVCVGFPKTGTTTICEALSQAGWNTIHRRVPGHRLAIGVTMYRNYLAGRPIMHSLEGIEAITQLDYSRKRMNLWPQMNRSFLTQLRKENPDVKFILHTRHIPDTIKSIRNWNNLVDRIRGAPGLNGHEDHHMELWIRRHYERIRYWFPDTIVFSISDPRNPEPLERGLGINLPWWGVANARS